ncbi:MAG: FeoB small GTPase domain-containing protein [Heliobacteriaceae bacterium]|nr:FeoB small GTPase domain-containing protein [Heliobacteriaceae bacterium]MDD4587917.1 FeoB small GTPase domain-containing protein [Heliobacteriaceae bacterium]
MGSTRKEPVIALAGNPNTGKSTLFNALTGLRQHTGNWPGKTVLQTKGSYIYKGRKYTLVDLPGTYSLLANSLEEQVARDFICFGGPDATIVVVDATCLERNLNLALQITEITAKVVVCVNLIDEARRKKLKIDREKLSCLLGVPVVTTAARGGEGLPQLLNLVDQVVKGEIRPQPRLVQYDPEVETAVAKLVPQVKAVLGDLVNARWLSLRLLEGDLTLIEAVEKLTGKNKHVPCGWC